MEHPTMDSTMNILLSTIPGLLLPPTLCLSLPASLTTHDLLNVIAHLLPPNAVAKTFVATSNGRRVPDSRVLSLHQLSPLSCAENASSSSQLMSLRLHVPLVGGKGGFGSQLRAAGGRMSSRKKKQNAELATGSARNLDGRRLRTITEAKNLATYLATKPEMDRKEKEEKRKRWEQVIELAEQREADMRAGKTADGRRKGSSEEWIQEKEDVGDIVKNAVRIAMQAETSSDSVKRRGSGSDQSPSDSANENTDEEDAMELEEEDMLRLRKEAEAGDSDAIWVLRNQLKIPSEYLPQQTPQTRRYIGFDDDDLSSSDEEDQEEIESSTKGKAVINN